MGPQWASVLGDVPLFEGLSQRHLRKISKIGTQKRVAPHTAVVRVGEKGDAFFVILDGNASVRRRGRRTVSLGPGDFFGELALLDDSPRAATVEAETEMLLMRLSRSSFQKLLKSEPQIPLRMLQALARIVRSEEMP